jgi:D-glycero-alpha-D-manno-heptose-7-phosphate kinase
MIIVKTPLRVSFFGGGSDLPWFYQYNEGLCVSTTINRYIYLAINRCKADHIRLSYSNYEVKNRVGDINHNIIRETLKWFSIFNNIEISSFSDIPHAGSGLGSSSSFAVGLADGLQTMLHDRYSPSLLAETACEIEIERCKQPIGKQDQYAAAFGGFNTYRFKRDRVEVEPVNFYQICKGMLNDNLMFFNTGATRSASTILERQNDSLKRGNGIEKTKNLVKMAEQSIKYLELGKLDDFGTLLDEAWNVKKNIASGITNPEIDDMYSKAMKEGALGGKILGAGGGGYLMMYVPEDRQLAVASALKNYEQEKFRFTDNRSKVTFV